MNGVIYARYSEGPRQTDQSIEGQVTDCTAFAEREGINIIGVYADRHVSGKSTAGRDEFLRMLHDAEHHRFDCVIVWKIDRFGRSRQDIAISKLRLKKAGVALKYAQESVPEGPEGIILESVLEGLAEYYSADLKQKVTRGIRESAKKGMVHGGIMPIGYAKTPDRHVIIDEPAASGIRKAFDMHISGNSSDEISKMLSLVTGRKVDRNAVFRLLRNPRYCGSWEVAGVPIDVPAIISEEIFMEAQRHFKTSRNNAAAKSTADYLLSGKCVCGYCGRSITADCGTSKSGSLYRYYSCSGRKKGKTVCQLKPIKKESLEKAVLNATIQDMLQDEVIDAIVKKIMEIQENDRKNDYAATLRSHLQDARRRQSNLVKALEYAPDVRAVSDRLRDVQEEVEDLQVQIAKEEMERPFIPEDVIRYWIGRYKDLDVTDEKLCREMVRTFIQRIELRNGEALIFFNVSDPIRCSDTARILEWSKLNPNTSNIICTTESSSVYLMFPYIIVQLKIEMKGNR